MNICKNKSKLSTIALILVLVISATLIALPGATAQDTYREKTTHPYIGATPNPIGVNQQVLLHVGITDYLATTAHGWEGLTVTVTTPDGQTETLGPFRTDATGGTGAVYVPTLVGTYYFQTHFPAQWYNWTFPPMFDPDIYGDIWYKASDSEELAVVVQEEPREYYPGSPLPTEYWTRPIDAQHREWQTISANWVTPPTNLYAPYNDDAPETGHILWAKAFTYGGLAGGDMGDHAFDCGDAYEGKYAGSVVINGILVYNRYSMGFGGGMPQQGMVAVDLRTGEELWFKNNTRLSFGQVFYWDSYNMHSVFAYLWAIESIFDVAAFSSVDNWVAYDPFTGEWVCTLNDMPAGGVMFGASYTLRGPKGEILIYETDLANGWMALWNSSRVVTGPESEFEGGSWRPFGNVYDNARIRGQEWNKTIATGLPGTIRATLDDRMIGDTSTGWTGMGDKPIEQWCISLEPGHEGELLWQNTYTPPPGELSITYGGASLEDGVFVYEIKETRQYLGFDIDTGNQIWGPTDSQEYLGIYGMDTNIAYGKIFSTGMHGNLYCYDADTGNLEWTYTALDQYTEILWSNNWPLFQVAITDGKIYVQHHEHSPVDPKSRGAPFICIDIETGEKIWSLPIRGTNWGGDPVIADSIIAMYNTYYQRILAIGKGPSQTTVTAPLMGVPLGSSVILRGTVTDESAGTKDSGLMARFPAGVPAVSDESMTDWMKYVYLQFARPTNTVGVPVTLETIDPNGNYVNIGTATTDAPGNYGFTFEPEVPGQYMILATFYGSDGYYASTTTTYLTVDPAPAPAQQIEPEPAAPEPTQPEPTQQYRAPTLTEPELTAETSLITTEVAILAAVAVAAVIGIAAYWALKKRK
ncbi:hypothetical protein ES707_19842 [subsurface metagenome]